MSFTVTLAVMATVPSCAQEGGEGVVIGALRVPDCWSGAFDLEPTFFGGLPFREEGLAIRIQNGSDAPTFSDGVSLFVRDVRLVRPGGEGEGEGKLGEALPVDLPVGVAPPGHPVVPEADPAIVSLTTYLQRSCRTQNPTLYAVREVSLPEDGSCDVPSVSGTDPLSGCDPAAPGPSGPGGGKSFAAFVELYTADPSETRASERNTAGCFDIYLADPREIDPTGEGPPPPCRGHLKGRFRFFFERGRPAQPFP